MTTKVNAKVSQNQMVHRIVCRVAADRFRRLGREKTRRVQLQRRALARGDDAQEFRLVKNGNGERDLPRAGSLAGKDRNYRI